MQETIIEAGRSHKKYWAEIFGAKELIWILALRDISVRYKQTVLGLAWSVVKPISTMLVFVFFFNRIAKVGVEPGLEQHIAMVVYSGVLMWTFFSTALQQVSLSIVGNSSMVTKVYFPRLVLPIASGSVALVDFVIGIALFIPLYFRHHFTPGIEILAVPLFVILAYFLALGTGLIFAVFNVQYRDFGQILPFVIQFGLFFFPVTYSSFNIESLWWYKYYNFIPVVGLLDGFRWCMLDGLAPFKWHSFIPAVVITILVNWIAIYFFRKKENTFVDYI